MESEAEEIYMPDGHFRQGQGMRRGHRHSTTTEDDSGIIGYQKYLHIVNRLAVDNTDAAEPRQPALSQFLRVSAEEEEHEMAMRLEKYQAVR